MRADDGATCARKAAGIQRAEAAAAILDWLEKYRKLGERISRYMLDVFTCQSAIAERAARINAAVGQRGRVREPDLQEEVRQLRRFQLTLGSGVGSGFLDEVAKHVLGSGWQPAVAQVGVSWIELVAQVWVATGPM